MQLPRSGLGDLVQLPGVAEDWLGSRLVTTGRGSARAAAGVPFRHHLGCEGPRRNPQARSLLRNRAVESLTIGPANLAFDDPPGSSPSVACQRFDREAIRWPSVSKRRRTSAVAATPAWFGASRSTVPVRTSPSLTYEPAQRRTADRQPAARMRRTDVRPIPSRRAISEWLTPWALSRRTSAAFNAQFRGGRNLTDTVGEFSLAVARPELRPARTVRHSGHGSGVGQLPHP